MRHAILLTLLTLLLAGCPGWVKAVKSTATAVADICDAVAGSPGLVRVPPPADCRVTPQP